MIPPPPPFVNDNLRKNAREEEIFPFFGRAADFCAPCIVFPPRGKTICRSRTKERRRAHEGEEPEQGAEHQSEPGAEPEHQPALSLHKNGKGRHEAVPFPRFFRKSFLVFSGEVLYNRCVIIQERKRRMTDAIVQWLLSAGEENSLRPCSFRCCRSSSCAAGCPRA